MRSGSHSQHEYVTATESSDVNEYRYRLYDERDESNVLDLLNTCFETGRWNQSFFRWQYGEVAGCRPVISLAVRTADDQAVAFSSLVPIRLSCQGKEILSGLSVLAMCHPQCRGRGLYTATANHVMQHATAAGMTVVMGFSNRHSTRAVLTRLGRQQVGVSPLWIKIRKPLASMMAIFRGDRPIPYENQNPLIRAETMETTCSVQAVNQAIPWRLSDRQRHCFDDLWRHRAQQIGIGVVRDSRYVQWRYLDRPDRSYALYALESHDDQWIAWVSLTVREHFGMRVCYVADIVHRTSPQKTLNRFFREVIDAFARRYDCSVICTMWPRGCLDLATPTRLGFVPIPEKLFPQRLCFSVKYLVSFPELQRLYEPNTWDVSWGQTDLI